MQNFYNCRRGKSHARSTADLLEARSRRQQILCPSLSVASWFVLRVFLESYFVSRLLSANLLRLVEKKIVWGDEVRQSSLSVASFEKRLFSIIDVFFALYSSFVHSLTAVAPSLFGCGLVEWCLQFQLNLCDERARRSSWVRNIDANRVGRVDFCASNECTVESMLWMENVLSE